MRSVCATETALAAVKEDGSVAAWGDKDRGGDCSAVQEQLRAGVRSVCATETALAAVKEDGSVVSWGRNAGEAEKLARSEAANNR